MVRSVAGDGTGVFTSGEAVKQKIHPAKIMWRQALRNRSKTYGEGRAARALLLFVNHWLRCGRSDVPGRTLAQHWQDGKHGP
jgi:hypothetical protein